MKTLSEQGVIPKNKESSCCGARVYAPTDDYALCMDCHEPCDAIEVEQDPCWGCGREMCTCDKGVQELKDSIL